MSLSTYPEYKDSGDPILGLVPKHWALSPLKAVVNIDNSGCYGLEPDEADAQLPVATTAQIDSLGHFNIAEMPIRGFSATEVERYSCVPGEILVVKSSGSATNIISGKAGLVDEKASRFVFSNFLLRLRPFRENVFPKFLYGIVSSGLTRERVQIMCSSTTYPNLKVGEYTSATIALPPMSEQITIAAFLDYETAKIDALVAEQEKLIALLKEKRQAVISYAVTKGLTPNAPMKDSGIEWLGEVPAHWEFKRVKDCGCEIVDCKNRTPEPHPDEKFFVVRTSCIKDGTFNPEPGYFTDEQSFVEWTAKGRPRAGDVLFTREAPTGEACLAPEGIDFCLGQRMMYIRPPTESLTSKFLLYSIYGGLIRERINEKSKGSTVGHLRVGEVGELPLLLPPIIEQEALINFLDFELSKIQTLNETSEHVIALLQERRSALISAAVTGKIDVRQYKATEAA